MSLLPFQQSDVVVWRGEVGRVTEVRGERVVVETADGMVHITNVDVLRAMQPVARAS